MAVFCPECKTEIKEGQVYCPGCGYDIQIVPEFDARIELEIDEVMSGILNGLNIEDLTLEERQELARTHDIQKTREIRDRLLNKKDEQTKTDNIISGLFKKVKRVPRRLFLFLIAVVIVGGILAIFSILQPQGTVGRMDKAASEMESGNYENAKVLLLEALNDEPENSDILLMLGKVCLYLEDEEGCAEYLYPLKEQGSLEAYDIILGYYIEKDNLRQVAKELWQCTNEAVLSKYAEYVVSPPGFSEKEGVYDKPVRVGIQAEQEGKIYYTLDGSEPDEQAEEYKKPILLQYGKNVVRAVFINERGVKSESISGIFEIEEPPIADPVVLTESGDYEKAVYIEVSEASECSVYYTTDGTMPDASSERYEGVLPMPMGDSSFKFVAIDVSGRRSDITSVNYHLSVPAMCRESEAVNFCVMSLMATGKLLDTYGHALDGSGPYNYKCMGIHSSDTGNYYIIRELMKGEERDVETGDYYAVDTVTGTLLRAVRSDDGYFELKAF